MPPGTLDVPPPVSRKESQEWLESKGIIARVPTIRSRDFALVNDCRFLFYLTRRLSLSSPFSSSEALRKGSWFHTRLEAMGRDKDVVAAHMKAKLDARCAELKDICRQLNLGQETVATIVAREKEDALNAWAWFEAAAQFKRPDIPELRNGFEAHLSRLGMRSLGRELRLCLQHKEGKHEVTLVAQLDELLYSVDTNLLWITDAKSTSDDPVERAATMPVEFQPRHFSYVFNELMERGVIQSHFRLPSDVRFGGFIHLIVRKPAIRMGQKDRPYILESHGVRKKMKGRAIRKGPDLWVCMACDIDRADWPSVFNNPTPLTSEEGAAKWLQETCGKLPERVYTGEPDRVLYYNRCRTWYDGTGDYAADRDERMGSNPPVNISTIGASHFLDEDNLAEYRDQLKRVIHYATCPAEPALFDRTPTGMSNKDYAPFYTAPVNLWPNLILRQRLLQQPWDEDVLSLPPPDRTRIQEPA